MGLGSMFLDAIDATVQSIASWPASGTRVDGLAEALDVRRAPVSRYPYHLAYLVTDDEIHVLAVAHYHRRPTYWAGRT
jgi:plasmid stabilization system protein ParE